MACPSTSVSSCNNSARKPIKLAEDQRVKDREETQIKCKSKEEAEHQEPDILEEIEVEDFAVDGICGVY
jgi:mycofactocin precursor